jgi:hypothetical protein
MTGPHATEARRLELSDPDTLRRLRDLQRASYAVEVLVKEPPDAVSGTTAAAQRSTRTSSTSGHKDTPV